MIDRILHINGLQLGASSSSSRSGATNNVPTRTITEAKASDEYGIYIVPFESGYGIIVSDGVSTWNIKINNTESVTDALHRFFTQYYKYSLLPQQNENGTYSSSTSTRSGSTSSGSSSRGGSYMRGIDGLVSNLTKSFESMIDEDDDDFDASFDRRNYEINADSADYNVALTNKKLLTLTNILANGNPTYKYFTVPYGYYYIGKDVDTSPYVSVDNSKDAITTGEYVDYNLRNNEKQDWIDDNTNKNAAATAATENKTMTYILYGLATLFSLKLMFNKKKKK